MGDEEFQKTDIQIEVEKEINKENVDNRKEIEKVRRELERRNKKKR